MTTDMRAALEYAAQTLSSDWPERCQEIVRRARAALAQPADPTNMRAALADAKAIIEDYAQHNPTWTDSRGFTQDPCGAHAWLAKFGSLSVHGSEPAEPPDMRAALERALFAMKYHQWHWKSEASTDMKRKAVEIVSAALSAQRATAASDEREAFERWANSMDFNIHRDESDPKYANYHRATTRFARGGWEAALKWAARTAPAAPVQPVALQGGLTNDELNAALKSKLRPGMTFTRHDEMLFALGIEWQAARAAPPAPPEGWIDPRDLSLVLHELAGEASMCWKPIPEGVFWSERAIEAVERAIQRLRDGVVRAAPTTTPEAKQP